MSQQARPISLTSADWTGTAAALADESDSTFLESAVSPTASQTFLCSLSSLADPMVSTGHQFRIRAAKDPADGEAVDLVVALEQSGTGNVIATRIFADVSSLYTEHVFALSAAEAELVTDYSALRLRGYGCASIERAFTWSSVSGATSYVLQVGSATGESGVFNQDVGNVLSHYLYLSSGTYYSRVVPQGAGSTTDEQVTTI